MFSPDSPELGQAVRHSTGDDIVPWTLATWGAQVSPASDYQRETVDTKTGINSYWRHRSGQGTKNWASKKSISNS